MTELLAALRAAAEPTRLRLLAVCGRAELTVTELTQVLAQSQPRVSRHLKVLCDAGLIRRHAEGKSVFYRLGDHGQGGALARWLLDRSPADDGDAALDRERLAAVRAMRQAAATAYFNAQAEDWDAMRALYGGEERVEAAIMDLSSGRRIDELVDIGTGTGRILELLAPLARGAVGIDLSHEMLGFARAKLVGLDHADCLVRHGNMYQLPMAAGSTDLAVIHQVLHFADDPAAAVAEAARILRPGGRLIIVDFAAHGLEYLRTEREHRRLGFADAVIQGWCRHAGLVPGATLTLPGDPLTVSVWHADRAVPPAAHHAAPSAVVNQV